MERKTFVTTMPNKTGAFLVAAKIIAKHDGNIVRVSYNKAVDLNTLFIDVVADQASLGMIGEELDSIGYLNRQHLEINVIMVEITIPDEPAALIPVLKILDRYDVNISYMNSIQNKTDYQKFVMGLLIENPKVIELLLDEIKELYPIKIIGGEDAGNHYDNSIFYIRLANEVKTILGLSQDQTMEFISEANRVLQMLQNAHESPEKVFAAIREFVSFMNDHRGDRFTVRIDKIILSSMVTLYAIQPVCGSNTYLFQTNQDLVLVDCGYALYRDEMDGIFRKIIPDWDQRPKRIYITHADVDHCGLLSTISHATLYLNEKSADSLKRQRMGILDYREMKEYGFGYSKLSRIISNYSPPSLDHAVIFDQDTPKEHDQLLKIGELSLADLVFDIYEGSGGHLEGEMIYLARDGSLMLTGDILVNIESFSDEMKYFNAIAPYLMRSVNVDSGKANRTRQEVQSLIQETEKRTGRPCMIGGGHGALSVFKDKRLERKQTFS
ncbi:MAG: MBL fold metallo-hydrolase [Clostridiaceae bacterium]|nr:MBL fold metallo-hydrolase [Clostridiaceae bacterium]